MKIAKEAIGVEEGHEAEAEVNAEGEDEKTVLLARNIP